MAQVSYGTITITDTNDINRIYVEYCRSTSNQLSGTTVPDITVNWSESTPAWVDGQYIWQRTVVEKSGTLAKTYGTPVCLTGAQGETGDQGPQGPQGGTGAAGRSLTSTITQYTTAATSATITQSNMSSYTWSGNVPAYNANTPAYWVRITNVYSNPSSTEYIIYKDNGITDAVKTSHDANTTAATANSTANTANQTANTANNTANNANTKADQAVTNVNNLQNKLKYYWVNEVAHTNGVSGWTKPNYPAGTYAASGISGTTFDSENSSTYGYNTWYANGINLRYNAIKLGELTGSALTFYQPSTTSQGAKAMELSGTALKFYASNGTTVQAEFGGDLAKVSGQLIAQSGYIGTNESNRWFIGNRLNYDQTSSAALVSYGTAYIQLGEDGCWRLSTNRLHTGWNAASGSNVLHYPKWNNIYWDFGIHVPNQNANKFIYIRNYDSTNSGLTEAQILQDLQNNFESNVSVLDSWQYRFYVTADGNLYARNLYVLDDNGQATQIGGTDGVYLLKSGGTITGDLTVNGTLTGTLSGTATRVSKDLKIQLNGGTTEGTNQFTYNGGTAKTINITKSSVGLSNVENTALSTWAGSSNLTTTKVGTLAAAAIKGVDTSLTTSTTSTNLPTSAAVVNLIKQYLPLTGGNVTGTVTFGSSVSADELTVGDLVINGAASFTNNLQANTINGVEVGSSPKFTDVNVTQTATTTNAAYEVLFSYTADNTTRTEGARKTSTFTYNPNTKELTIGSVKIKEASTGFTISGGTTSKTLTVGGDYTLAAAAAKGVVTSIDTSANLPTSNAVKTFVEGKGYITANHTSTYSLPLAANGTRGGVQIGYTQSGKNYPVQLSSEKMYVNVPWTDTTYNAGIGLTLNGTTFKNYRGIEYIRGTWTAATNVWTGVSIDSELYDGKQIILYMPFAGTSTAATLELTLADGTTTGAKYVYFESTTRMTTHKGAYSQLHLIYHDSHNINGTNYSGWWYVANRDTNSNDTSTGYTRFSHGTFTTTTAVGRYVICLTKSVTQVVPVTAVNNSTATTKTLTTDTFNPFEPIFYYTNNGSTTQTVANSALSVSYLWRNYSNINLSYSFNTGSTLTNNKDVFIKATPTNGYMATLASTPIVQDLPTTDDGFIYIKLGHACSTSNIAMSYEHPIYWYKNGAVRSYGGDAATVTGKIPLFAHQDISGKADKSATVSTITYDSTNNKITKTINGTTTDVVTVATIKSAIGSLKNPNAIKINVYSGTNTATTTTYDGSTANQSVDVAGSTAITNVSASAASGGSTTFTLTKANGATSTFDVTVTASVATGATTITDANGNAVSEGSDTKPVYFSNGVPEEAKTYAGGTSVTLNGTSKAESTASFYAPTSAGTAKQILVSTAGAPEWKTVATGSTNGTIKIGTDEYAVKGLAAAAYKALADSSSASAIGTGTNVTTERDVYYGLPTINNVHNYTSSTTIYAPTAGGTSSQVLIGNGTTSAPVWTDISGLVPSNATNATNDSDGNPINTTYIKKSIGTAAGDIIYWSAASTPTRLAKGSNGQVLKLANGVPTWGTDNNDNTTYSLSGSLSSHKFTTTLTPSSGSATTSAFTLAAGSNISLTDSGTTITIAATDVKVTQTNSTGNADYRLLFSENANDTTSTETTRKSTYLKFNPSSGLLKTYGISSASGSTPVIYSDVSAAEIKEVDSSLTTSSSDSDWLKALLIALCNKYPGKTGYIFKGTMSPNSVGWYEVHIYSTSIKDSTTGLPQYSFGRFLKYINNYSLFGTASYSYSYRTVDTNTWNPLTTSQSGYVSTAPNDTKKFLRGDATWAQVSSANLSDIRLTWSNSVSTTDWILAHDTAATGTPLFRAMSPANLKTTMSLNNVENTKLSTWAGSSNITTVGTISSGTWNGSAIPIANGGTGATTAVKARTNLGLGSAATYTAATSVGNNSNLPTGAAIQTYVSGVVGNYVTIGTDQTITANQKTFNGAIRWGTASKYGAAHYDSTLEAIVFSFA